MCFVFWHQRHRYCCWWRLHVSLEVFIQHPVKAPSKSSQSVQSFTPPMITKFEYQRVFSKGQRRKLISSLAFRNRINKSSRQERNSLLGLSQQFQFQAQEADTNTRNCHQQRFLSLWCQKTKQMRRFGSRLKRIPLKDLDEVDNI